MTVRRIAGVVLVLLGVLWILQGLDIAKGSGMSGHAIWAVFGLVLVVVGGALLRAGGRIRPPRP